MHVIQSNGKLLSCLKHCQRFYIVVINVDVEIEFLIGLLLGDDNSSQILTTPKFIAVVLTIIKSVTCVGQRNTVSIVASELRI